MIRVLFFGHTAAPANDASALKGLRAQAGLQVTVLDPGRFHVPGYSLAVRALRRLTTPLANRLMRATLRRQARLADVVLTFKGMALDASTLRALRAQGVKTACYFPDGHPHAYGRALQDALAEYDLIISAKADHPARWSEEFGYSNRCVHVPHGYDADLHLAADIARPEEQTADIAMVATARDEYFTLLQQMVEAAPELADRKVVIGGPDWAPYRAALSSGWQFPGPQIGAQYVASLRSARIVVAPVQRTVRIDGREVAYDSDTARTYELAAMGVFFVHRHSDLMPQIFDPEAEVPLFRDGAELAQLARTYLDAPQERMKMARALRARAVPAYSWDARAADVASHLRTLVGKDMPEGQQTA